MSHVRSYLAAISEEKNTNQSQYEVNITHAEIDKNNYLRINYDINENIKFAFMCITDNDNLTFNGCDWQHPTKNTHKGSFNFKLDDDFPFATARICLYSKDGIYDFFSPRGGKLIGKSPLIRDCLAQSNIPENEMRILYFV